MHNTLFLQFQSAAEQFPNNKCLLDAGKSLTYTQALSLVNRLANSLSSQKLNQRNVVALYGEKSIESILMFLALSKLGITCLTLDLAFPSELIAFVLKDSEAKSIIGTKPLPVETQLPQFTYDELIELPKTDESDSPAFSGAHTAWLVYSSGTTGKPKGVKLSSDAVVGSYLARAEKFSYQPTEKVACNIYFFWECFRPLFFGAAVYVVTDNLMFDLTAYVDFLDEKNINDTLWTPSFAEVLLSNLSMEAIQKISRLKRVWLNGEVVAAKLATDLLDNLPTVNFINLYSISETLDVSAEVITKVKVSADSCTCIGKPLPNIDIWVVNSKGQKCKALEPGELYLESPFVAEGYINRPEAEAKKFVNLAIDRSKRCYKTGDTGFYSESGDIYILGRNDHIVKLRGYNISLLAIEDIMKRVLPLKQCVVKLFGEQASSQVLSVTMEPCEPTTFLAEYPIDTETGISTKLQHYLSEYLPRYAIPSLFSVTEEFKLSAYSAKLDRKKVATPQQSDPFISIWQNIFGLPSSHFDEETDFYALGGNSLQAIQLIQMINRQYQHQLSIAILDTHSTVGELRSLIKDKLTSVDNEIDFKQEAMVDYSSYAASLPVKPYHSRESVFVTGCSGFLGAHWLAQGLQSTPFNFYCLIRAKNESQALQKLEGAFEKYQLKLDKSRVKVIVGDITLPQFGIEQSIWDELSNNADLVWHAAAYVNLLEGYLSLKPSIVEGTKQILAFCASVKIKPLIYISSDAVLPNIKEVSFDKQLSEDSFEKLTYGYAQAKWIAEYAIFQSAIPYHIARLGNLSPSLETGLINENDANGMAFKLIQKMNIIPDNFEIEFTPVNKIAQHFIEISLQEISCSTQTLSQFNMINSDFIKSHINPELKTVSYEKWQEMLIFPDPTMYALSQIEGLFSPRKYTNPYLLTSMAISNELKAKQITEMLYQGEIYESLA